MKRIIPLAALIVALCSCEADGVEAPEYGYADPKQWELSWTDDFDYAGRDQLLQNWNSAKGPTSHTLCSRWPENVEVSDGTLRLINRKESRGGQDWTSGSIWTKRYFKYGYFECRYRYAAATGTNNSFWLSVLTGEPDEGKRFELDINEGHYPSEINVNIHNWTDSTVDEKGNSTHPSSQTKHSFPKIDFSRGFHVFGMEWDEKQFVFYLDGKEIRRSPNEFAFSPASLLLSEAILPWAGEVTDAIDGTFMEVDFVRVYKRRK